VADVQPFCAVRYDERRTGSVSDLVAPPYDVITADERGRYLERSRYNVARLIVPDSPDQAARLFVDWRAGGILVDEREPALWWMRESYEGPDGERHEREGFFGTVRLVPYEEGVVLPHERTYEQAKRSQLRLLRAVRANLSPIMLLYDDPQGRPHRALAPFADGDPVFEAVDGAASTKLWRVTDRDAIAEVQAALAERALVIADGHHRYETALAYHDESTARAGQSSSRRRASPRWTPWRSSSWASKACATPRAPKRRSPWWTRARRRVPSSCGRRR
jgi:uncharacterized protein (DUF1015 family)